MHKEHSINIDIIHTDDLFSLNMVLKGILTHKDYEMIIPLLENALEGVEEPRVKVLVDGREFEGWEPRAAWDDLKFGLKHSKEFEKLAFVGHKKWEEYGVKISNWFMSGEMRYFEDINDAKKWLNEKSANI